eukprot:Plantae.Rhodophyta-Hildenbrandia_rubra.ctg26307.p1 GENE.Plantae.Rhodophyta-Hildenbrandia_rubra.ctg26307~~Plantae.Rhodophyta-Hildenbrandia_rubra.ctg26307.p1  ORF type:complete len:127 (+),score=20.42 Plantae.Rhodophyta-Hildenbrandia_rubra.ctg26307:412-792(+)
MIKTSEVPNELDWDMILTHLDIVKILFAVQKKFYFTFLFKIDVLKAVTVQDRIDRVSKALNKTRDVFQRSKMKVCSYEGILEEERIAELDQFVSSFQRVCLQIVRLNYASNHLIPQELELLWGRML